MRRKGLKSNLMASAPVWSITIREDASGMFFATSEDEPTFFVSQPSRDALRKVIPIALQMTLLERRHEDLTVVTADDSDEDNLKVRLLPRAALEQMAACA